MRKKNSALAAVASLQKAMDARRPATTKAAKALAAKEKKVEAMRTRIAGMEEGFFAELSRQLGVENISDYEDTLLRVHEEQSSQRVRFTDQITSLENQITYEEKRDTVRVCPSQPPHLLRLLQLLQLLWWVAAAAARACVKLPPQCVIHLPARVLPVKKCAVLSSWGARLDSVFVELVLKTLCGRPSRSSGCSRI